MIDNLSEQMDDPALYNQQAEPFGLVRAVHSNGYASKLVVYTGPCILYGFTVYSSNVAAQWIQLFDTAGAGPASSNQVAALTVAATANLGVYYGSIGRPFLTGLTIANSTTGPTYTAGAADTYFDAVFRIV